MLVEHGLGPALIRNLVCVNESPKHSAQILMAWKRPFEITLWDSISLERQHWDGKARRICKDEFKADIVAVTLLVQAEEKVPERPKSLRR